LGFGWQAVLSDILLGLFDSAVSFCYAGAKLTTGTAMAKQYDEYIPSDKELDAMIATAVTAAGKGENIEQLQEIMLAQLPAEAREKLRKKFAAALAKRGLRQPTSHMVIPSQTTVARLRAMFTVTARQAIDRVMNLIRTRPDLAARIDAAGKTLARNGVVLDRSLSDDGLNNVTPSVAVAKSTDRSGGRG
jgi:hypothetical protein